jgi:PAS domain S-box-containing protein
MILKAKKTKTFRSLWITLAIAFMALSAVVLLIEGSLNLYLSLQNQRQLIINKQRFIAQKAAHTVKDFIQEKLGELNTVAHLGKIANVSQQEQKTTLEQLLGFEPAFRQVVLLNSQSQETAKVSRLSSLISYGFIKRISDGAFSYIRQGKTYIGSVYIDEITSEPMVIMGVPTADRFGDFKGALLAEVNLKFMWDLVGGIKVGNKGQAYVVDKFGNLIASGDISRVLKGENVSYLGEVGRFVSGGISVHDDNTRMIKGIQGKLVVSNHVHLGTPDWAVVVELPVLEAYETVITSFIISGLVIFLSFVLAIVAGIYLSKRITQPIVRLRDAAVQIGQGRLDTQIEVKKEDEIGDLAAAFNQMIRDLKRTTTSVDNLNREIIERKKTEDALRKNEEFTRRVIESSSDCIKVLDLDGRLLSMSYGGQRMLELDDASIYLNSSFIDFWKGKEKEDCIEAISKAKQGDTGIFYGSLKTGKGTPKSFEIVVTPVKDSDGSINRLLAVSRDITERKKAEETVENLNKDLRSTVTQLVQSNKQLQEFAHLAAHDLKTPLRGISTLAQWLVHDYRDKFDNEGRRQVDQLVDKVEQTNDLVNAILQYSTIARERDKEVPIDLNLLVETLLVEIRTPPNIEITINKSLPVVVCKESHIRLVFYHLLTNAIRFMDKPEGLITIDCADKSGSWEFSVSDNGPGIAPQHFERVFQFFQTLSDSSDGGVGAGMGLTISRKIIGLYGGKIWVTSEVGQGSTFFFTLPKVPGATNGKELLFAASH